MDTPKVTAIISAYYCEEWINGRITNLLAQEPQPEIIAVAQRSSPEASIISNTFPQVKLITTPDVPTVYGAWNMAINEAQGKYITSANSDDRLYPGALELLAKELDKNRRGTIGAVYADVDIAEEPGGQPYSRYKWAEGGHKELLKGCFLGPMPLWRASLHQEYGLFDEEMHSAGDYEYWLRLASNGVRFRKYKEEPLGVYAKLPGSVEHREPVRSLWETARARARYPIGDKSK